MFGYFLLLFIPPSCSTSATIREKTPVSDRQSGGELGSWSLWSTWTTCSRSCDGGITLSLRTCQTPVKSKKSRCTGEPIRRRICNTKACPESSDFRGAQCSAYDAIPYRGRLYQWLPFYDPDDPCTLTCQAKGYNFVAKLSTKVQDGTRCREGALDMCVQGQCKTVGCDLEVGSTMKVDECGVCGGDGSGCARAPVFVWSHKPFDPCPITCGGGIQASEAVCLQKESEKRVDPRLCDLTLRPRSKTRPCNNFACPVVWLAGDWGSCSATCGTGIKIRPMQCVQGGPNGTQIQVNNEFCPRHKPNTEKSCSVQECPRWFQGGWSDCSVSCGSGVQRRAVVCRDDRGHYSEDCNQETKPETDKDCGNDISCPEALPSTEPQPCITEGISEESIESSTATVTKKSEEVVTTPKVISSTVAEEEDGEEEDNGEDDDDEEEEEVKPEELVSVFHAGPWGPCTVSCGTGKRRRLVQCQAVSGEEVIVLPDYKCSGLRPVGVEACIIFCEPPLPPPLPPSTTTTSKPVEEKLVELEKKGEDEDEDESEEDDQKAKKKFEEEDEDEETAEITTPSLVVPQQPFIWKSPSGELFSPCTIVCQRGDEVEESQLLSRVVCAVKQADGVESQTVSTVGPCDKPTEVPNLKPDCRDIDCTSLAPWPRQPRWQVSEYSDCSVTCGGGHRTRTLRCVWHTTRNTEEDLPFQRCLGPQPSETDQCNVVDCPPKWKAEPWSKCSKSCGGGFQTRKLRCEMTVVHPSGTMLQLPPSRCTKARPKANKPCNRKPCPKTKLNNLKHKILSTTLSSIENENGQTMKLMTSRKVTTKASGQISVIKGSTIKVHCPTEHGNQSSVLWFKGRHRITTPQDAKRKSARRISISPLGTLRIRKVNFADSATYTCLIGHFRSDLQLHVRPFPPEGFSMHIEEIPEEEVEEEVTIIPEEVETIALEATEKSISLPRMRHFLINPGHEDENSVPPSDGQKYQQHPRFFWKTGPWSHCSQTCGEDGVQIRSLDCVVPLRESKAAENSTVRLEEASSVNNALCVDKGIPQPETSRPCLQDLCPEWVTGPWSACSATNCVSWNTAYQKREIRCKGEWQSCNDNVRPRRKRECFQPKCKSQWRTGPWSECTLTCGDSGIRMRRVECVWYGSGLQAGAYACKDTAQPETITACQAPPCAHPMVTECINQSSYCEVVRKTKLCHMSHFRLQCCASCSTDTKAIAIAKTRQPSPPSLS